MNGIMIEKKEIAADKLTKTNIQRAPHGLKN